MAKGNTPPGGHSPENSGAVVRNADGIHRYGPIGGGMRPFSLTSWLENPVLTLLVRLREQHTRFRKNYMMLSPRYTML